MSDPTTPGVPTHVAVIMDGNGRWAQQRGLPRNEGHSAGADSVREITRACRRMGVKHLTLYSFSTENWRRPDEEVAALMALLERYLRDELEELTTNQVRLRAIGELDRLPRSVRSLLEQVAAATAHQPGMELILALSYGSRTEIVRGVQEIARQVAAGALSPDAIDDATIEKHLYTAGVPDPDLLIRTSGELRLSNFLLWQLAYSELYVTDVLWPDFRKEHLEEAFRVYSARQRRFGKTGDQILQESE